MIGLTSCKTIFVIHICMHSIFTSANHFFAIHELSHSFSPSSAVDRPRITGQPAPHLLIVPGETVSFAVIAIGDNLMYQWQKDEVNNITAGANSAAYIIQSVKESDEGWYRCVVISAAGNAYMISNAARLTVSKCINYIMHKFI